VLGAAGAGCWGPAQAIPETARNPASAVFIFQFAIRKFELRFFARLLLEKLHQVVGAFFGIHQGELLDSGLF